MAIKIRLPYNTSSGVTPTASNLITGEMAVNTADAKMWVKHADGTLTLITNTGAQGATGVIGSQGATGPQGGGGSQGVTGPQGATGLTGTQGSTGSQGPQGPIGQIGSQGVIGPQGTQGPQGSQGLQGSVGLQGSTGPIGPTGSQGLTGFTGSTGPTGPTGPTGAQGTQGPAGACVPAVCNITCFPAGSKVLMANLSWKNIEDIKLGDLMWSPRGPAACTEEYVTKVGGRNMMTFEDRSLFWSEEHLFWTRKNNLQWWKTYNMDIVEYEVSLGRENGGVNGVKDIETIRSHSIDHDDHEYAHTSGWRKMKAFVDPDNEYEFNFPLYQPITNGEPIVVNGWLVTGGTDENKYDYTTLDWSQYYEKLNQELSEK